MRCKLSEETKKKISESMKNHVCSEETKRKMSKSHIGKKRPNGGLKGEKHPQWKGGISKNISKEDKNKYLKEWRHKNGISKNYCYCLGLLNTNERKKLHNQKYKNMKKNGGNLTIDTIQMIYEDNIKQYGTLTCYLCLNPISFGKDSLEHKIPLSRGGTNEYNNLAIACRICNSSKRMKTLEEFKNYKRRKYNNEKTHN